MTHVKFCELIQTDIGGIWSHVKTHKNGTDIFEGSYPELNAKVKISIPKGPYSGWRVTGNPNVKTHVWQAINRLQSRISTFNWDKEA